MVKLDKGYSQALKKLGDQQGPPFVFEHQGPQTNLNNYNYHDPRLHKQPPMSARSNRSYGSDFSSNTKFSSSSAPVSRTRIDLAKTGGRLLDNGYNGRLAGKILGVDRKAREAGFRSVGDVGASAMKSLWKWRPDVQQGNSSTAGEGERRNSLAAIKKMKELYTTGPLQLTPKPKQMKPKTPSPPLLPLQNQPIKDMTLTTEEFSQVERYFGGSGSSSSGGKTIHSSGDKTIRPSSPIIPSPTQEQQTHLLSPIRTTSETSSTSPIFSPSSNWKKTNFPHRSPPATPLINDTGASVDELIAWVGSIDVDGDVSEV